MSRLLSAGYSRLWKNKVFWLEMGAVLVYAVVFMLNGCRQAAANGGIGYSLDQFYFHFAVSVGLFGAIFTSLFIGTEYSDGTIRNTFVIGHSRAAVYLSNLLVSGSAMLLMAGVWMLAALIGVPFLGFWKTGAANLLLYLLIAVLFMAALTALFALVGMNVSGKAASAVASLLLALGLLLAAGMLFSSLSQPEMTSGVTVTADGMSMTDPMPNPSYVGGMRREVYTFLMDALPTGQGLLMANLSVERPLRMLAASAGIAAAATVGGIFLFRRKDLK